MKKSAAKRYQPIMKSEKTAKVLSGIPVRDAIAEELKEFVINRAISKLSIPHLAIVQVGDLPESSAYIRQKKIFGERIGAKVTHIQLAVDVTEKALIAKIKKLNEDVSVHGIIVQLPLPLHIDSARVIESIDSQKDIDGLTAPNVKHLITNDGKGIVPATARGVLTLCRAYNIDPKGKHIVVIGRSVLVGKPIAELFLNAGATVTVCHKQTKRLADHTQCADILIVAAGAPGLIRARHVRAGQVVIDVGITAKVSKNKNASRKLIGDVDIKSVSKIVKGLSPVPGGAGPLTVASLFENLCERCG